jgi:peptide/nickel transport system substrate-binding protein
MLRADIQGGITRNIFDPMAEVDYKSRNIVPFVAEAWKVVDPLTWRIKLREGIKWQKGYSEVTAEDLVYTWQFHQVSKSFQMGSALSALASIRLVDKYVAEVKTTISAAISSRPKRTGRWAIRRTAMPVGNGPFVIESRRGSEIVLTRNPDYWRPGLPKLERLIYRAVPDATTRVQAS